MSPGFEQRFLRGACRGDYQGQQASASLMARRSNLKDLTRIRCLPQWGSPHESGEIAVLETRFLRQFSHLQPIGHYHLDEEGLWAP